MLNPFNYFYTQEQIDSNFKSFMDRQNDIPRANFHLYPYTVENPYDSYVRKWITAMFGESSSAYAKRMELKSYATSVYDAIKVNPDILSGGNISGLGLGFNSPIPGIAVWDNASVIELENRLSRIPITPISSPLLKAINLPEALDLHNIWALGEAAPNSPLLSPSASVTLQPEFVEGSSGTSSNVHLTFTDT